jgi:hypothetical protein
MWMVKGWRENLTEDYELTGREKCDVMILWQICQRQFFDLRFF